MLVCLFAENPYTFAALLALVWVFLVILPVWLFCRKAK